MNVGHQPSGIASEQFSPPRGSSRLQSKMPSSYLQRLLLRGLRPLAVIAGGAQASDSPIFKSHVFVIVRLAWYCFSFGPLRLMLRFEASVSFIFMSLFQWMAYLEQTHSNTSCQWLFVCLCVCPCRPVSSFASTNLSVHLLVRSHFVGYNENGSVFALCLFRDYEPPGGDVPRGYQSSHVLIGEPTQSQHNNATTFA